VSDVSYTLHAAAIQSIAETVSVNCCSISSWHDECVFADDCLYIGFHCMHWPVTAVPEGACAALHKASTDSALIVLLSTNWAQAAMYIVLFSKLAAAARNLIASAAVILYD
jgi:hypothetical protein